ncbi:MAG: class I SAM-dependent methyltransferase [Cyanobacteria bacterium SBLK]|nr:class I SAM-dependent methyltransferase [Cyanobacteria bacterium SBLK]
MLESSISSSSEVAIADEYLYPEHSLSGRYAKAFQWTPDTINSLLDAGCAWGYGTRFFCQKSKRVCGLDPDAKYIEIARSRYADIEFVTATLETVPFPSEAFETIVACDTLEHVDDEIQCLTEIFRLLKKDGILIVSVPHKGTFEFMDPENAIPYIEYFLKRYLSGLFQLAYWLRKRQWPERDKMVWEKPNRDRLHRHYTKAELLALLDRSAAKGNYKLIDTFRSGLFLEVFVHNLEFYTALFFRGKAIEKILNIFLLKPLNKLAKIDYWIPYNVFAYNIALKIVKTS